MPKGSIAIKPGTITTQTKSFSTSTGPKWVEWRKRRFEDEKFVKSIKNKIELFNIPKKDFKAGTTIFRIMQKKKDFNLNYYQLLSQPPGGGLAVDNRYSGSLDGKTEGPSGSYWGAIHGIAPEGFFYSCIMGCNPDDGILKISPPQVSLVINGLQNHLPYSGGAVDVPSEMLFFGSYNSIVVVGQTIRDLEVADFDVNSEKFEEFNYRGTKSLTTELNELGYVSLREAMDDPDIRNLTKLTANVIYRRGEHEGIEYLSLRRNQQGYNAKNFNPKEAKNLVLLGKSRESLTDKLRGLCVIDVSPDPDPDAPGPGAKATIYPISKYYPSSPDSKLIRISHSNLILRESTEKKKPNDGEKPNDEEKKPTGDEKKQAEGEKRPTDDEKKPSKSETKPTESETKPTEGEKSEEQAAD